MKKAVVKPPRIITIIRPNTVAAVDYYQMVVKDLYGPGKYNADLQ